MSDWGSERHIEGDGDVVTRAFVFVPGESPQRVESQERASSRSPAEWRWPTRLQKLHDVFFTVTVQPVIVGHHSQGRGRCRNGRNGGSIGVMW